MWCNWKIKPTCRFCRLPQMAGINREKCSGVHSMLHAEGLTAKHHLFFPAWVEVIWPLMLSNVFVPLSKKGVSEPVFNNTVMLRPGKLLIRPQSARVVVSFANNLSVHVLQCLKYKRHFLHTCKVKGLHCSPHRNREKVQPGAGFEHGTAMLRKPCSKRGEGASVLYLNTGLGI